MCTFETFKDIYENNYLRTEPLKLIFNVDDEILNKMYKRHLKKQGDLFDINYMCKLKSAVKIYGRYYEKMNNEDERKKMCEKRRSYYNDKLKNKTIICEGCKKEMKYYYYYTIHKKGCYDLLKLNV
jgi:hypothetical protein